MRRREVNSREVPAASSLFPTAALATPKGVGVVVGVIVVVVVVAVILITSVVVFSPAIKVIRVFVLQCGQSVAAKVVGTLTSCIFCGGDDGEGRNG